MNPTNLAIENLSPVIDAAGGMAGAGGSAGVASNARVMQEMAHQGMSVPSSGADILNALISLGYNEKEALYAIKQLPADAAVADGIRQALKMLSKS